jgi:hypothetical protein
MEKPMTDKFTKVVELNRGELNQLKAILHFIEECNEARPGSPVRVAAHRLLAKLANHREEVALRHRLRSES